MHQYVANKLIEVNNNKLIIEVNKTLSAAKRQPGSANVSDVQIVHSIRTCQGE